LSHLSDMLGDYDPRFQEPLARLREAASLVLMVLAIWEVVRRLTVGLMEESLAVRAQQPELWPVCGRCRQWLRSKGFQPRTLQCTGAEVRWMGCLLAMCVPYETARRLLQQLTGIERAAGTLWGWVQQVGQRVKTIFTMSISKPPACRLAVA